MCESFLFINFPLWNLPGGRIVTIIVLFNQTLRGTILSSRYISAILLCLSPAIFAAEESNVSVEVIPLVEEISPGEPFEVAVVFNMESEWHIYWQNPGDAGIPTTFDWSLPPQFEILDMREPVPVRHIDEGITTFIHEKETIFLFKFQAPDVFPDTTVFEVMIDWLECKSICLAGADTVQFSLPHAFEIQGSVLKDRALSQFPDPVEKGAWAARTKRKMVELKNLKPRGRSFKLVEVDFFPSTEMIYDIETKARLKRGLRRDTIQIPLSEYHDAEPKSVEGILVQKFSTPKGVVTTNTMIQELILQ